MVRRGLMSREDAIEKELHEGKFPTSYLGKPLEDILKKIDMTLTEFKLTCDKFTNKIFKCNQANELIKDKNNNLTLK